MYIYSSKFRAKYLPQNSEKLFWLQANIGMLIKSYSVTGYIEFTGLDLTRTLRAISGYEKTYDLHDFRHMHDRIVLDG